MCVLVVTDHLMKSAISDWSQVPSENSEKVVQSWKENDCDNHGQTGSKKRFSQPDNPSTTNTFSVGVAVLRFVDD